MAKMYLWGKCLVNNWALSQYKHSDNSSPIHFRIMYIYGEHTTVHTIQPGCLPREQWTYWITELIGTVLNSDFSFKKNYLKVMSSDMDPAPSRTAVGNSETNCHSAGRILLFHISCANAELQPPVCWACAELHCPCAEPSCMLNQCQFIKNIKHWILHSKLNCSYIGFLMQKTATKISYACVSLMWQRSTHICKFLRFYQSNFLSSSCTSHKFN